MVGPMKKVEKRDPPKVGILNSNHILNSHHMMPMSYLCINNILFVNCQCYIS